ncbi:MAG TPA: nucleoside deaminase [Casimicrobiaceae bacterium]
MKTNEDYLALAIRLARKNIDEHGGRPFGAVLVKDGEIVATGVNEIHATNDPSTHAEMQAIRAAATARRSPRLDGCVMYASGNPCPMCLSLMHMIGIGEVYYAYSNEDGEPFNLSTAKIYAEMAKPLSQQSIRIVHLPVREAEHLYEVWRRAGNR